ncbi:hypothetical protein [Nonomuraea sp. NPDC050310]|uniref:hypothetical protein n=1 Tax=unclassified Nonomuraea TaxID=2593643 RepID=UPI0033C59CB3
MKVRSVLLAVALGLTLLAPPAQAATTATKVFGFLHAAGGGELWFAKGKIWPHPEFEAWQWKRTGKWRKHEVAPGAKLYVNILAGQSQSKKVSYSWLNTKLRPKATKQMGFHVWFSGKKIVRVQQVYTP